MILANVAQIVENIMCEFLLQQNYNNFNRQNSKEKRQRSNSIEQVDGLKSNELSYGNDKAIQELFDDNLKVFYENMMQLERITYILLTKDDNKQAKISKAIQKYTERTEENNKTITMFGYRLKNSTKSQEGENEKIKNQLMDLGEQLRKLEEKSNFVFKNNTSKIDEQLNRIANDNSDKQHAWDQELQELIKQQDEVVKEGIVKEKKLRNAIVKIECHIEETLTKYDQAMFELQDEYDALLDENKAELLELGKRKKEFKNLEKEYNKMYQELEEAEAERKKEEEQLKMQKSMEEMQKSKNRRGRRRGRK